MALREMVRIVFSKPGTILYPKEKVPVPEGFRGRVELIDENCIGCGKCAQVLPANAIHQAGFGMIMAVFAVHLILKPMHVV